VNAETDRYFVVSEVVPSVVGEMSLFVTVEELNVALTRQNHPRDSVHIEIQMVCAPSFFSENATGTKDTIASLNMN
jgi:hypothetical protein